MGAKTWIVVQSEGDARALLAQQPVIDEAATAGLVATLFPGVVFGEPRDADLSWTAPQDGVVVAGCFPGMRVVISTALAVDRPSELPPRFIAAQGTTLLHVMHSVVDWCALAVWKDGVLQRSLSVSPDGVIEDIGERLAFEAPYWAGEHPVEPMDEDDDDYPLPFHPLELGESALQAFFGFQLEGFVDTTLLEPERIRLLLFEAGAPVAAPPANRKPWWRFW